LLPRLKHVIKLSPGVEIRCTSGHVNRGAWTNIHVQWLNVESGQYAAEC